MNNEKYLFLDIDGVLVTQRTWMARHRCVFPHHEQGFVFDNVAVDFLSRLFKANDNIKLVISSQGWGRTENSSDRLKMLLQVKYDLYCNVPDALDRNNSKDGIFFGPHADELEIRMSDGDSPSRYDYIEQYLKWYPAETYAIIDDVPKPPVSSPLYNNWFEIDSVNGISHQQMMDIYRHFDQESNANTGCAL